MKTFEQLTGYNANAFVKVPHVFIYGEGTFYETPELARANYGLTGNEVGFSIKSFTHEGVEIFKGTQTNVWD